MLAQLRVLLLAPQTRDFDTKDASPPVAESRSMGGGRQAGGRGAGVGGVGSAKQQRREGSGRVVGLAPHRSRQAASPRFSNAAMSAQRLGPLAATCSRSFASSSSLH
eukprot:SAG31_NODE_9193_length_1316_cov_69.831009_1_plen_106_part_10